jgi:hypothetical protein
MQIHPDAVASAADFVRATTMAGMRTGLLFWSTPDDPACAAPLPTTMVLLPGHGDPQAAAHNLEPRP